MFFAPAAAQYDVGTQMLRASPAASPEAQWATLAGSQQPSPASSAPVHEIAKRGVRIGRTSGSAALGASGSARMCAMSARVAARDASGEGST